MCVILTLVMKPSDFDHPEPLVALTASQLAELLAGVVLYGFVATRDGVIDRRKARKCMMGLIEQVLDDKA